MGPRRVAFAVLYHVGRTLERAGQVFFYLAAGTARLDELRGAIREQWDRDGAIQWESNAFAGFLDWERGFYPRFLRPDDRILVVGCGTGRDLIALLDGGHTAEGLDVAPHCVALARRAIEARGWSVPVHVGAVESFSLPSRYDVVILSTQVYSLIPQSATRIAVLRRVAARLETGGRLLLSYIWRRPPAPHPLLVRLARLTARLSRSDWRPEYGDLMLLDRRSMFLNYEHRFLPEEVEREAETAGLRIVFHEVDLEGKAVLVLP